MIANKVGRLVPSYVENLGTKKPYAGVFATPPTGESYAPPRRKPAGTGGKLLSSLREAILASGLRSGMTISFHHHFRNGDMLVNMVVDEIAARVRQSL